MLSIEAAKFIANLAQDTRSLEGLLLRVVTQAATENKEITLDLAKEALGNRGEEKKTHLHAEDIIEQVCLFYRIKPTQIKGPKRDASLVRARQVAMFLLKDLLHLPLVEIGNVLGGRDHTTIMHGVGKIELLVVEKSPVVSDIQGITRALRG